MQWLAELGVFASVAQLVLQVLGWQEVGGSQSPVLVGQNLSAP